MQSQHREQEIAAHRPIHPTGAQDRGAADESRVIVCSWCIRHRLLACGLAGAICANGIAGIFRSVGMALLTAEHEVGADLQQARVVAAVRRASAKALGAPVLTALASSSSDSARSTAV